MKIFNTKSSLTQFLSDSRSGKRTIGLVPTMGALHKGHLSLIEAARQEADVVVASIFVNPTQFNDPKDLEKYPRPVDADIELLRKHNCDVLFMPEVSEMYKPGEKWKIELGYLDTIMEGKIRPGHYQGVTQIVKKLFDAVQPDIAFFGQKDYQQIMVIKKMMRLYRIQTKIAVCPIIRENDGLAMSSRNIHLSEKERNAALSLSKSLKNAAKDFKELSLQKLKTNAEKFLNNTSLQLEYFDIRNAKDLSEAKTKRVKNIIALVAAKSGETRLIDNMMLN